MGSSVLLPVEVLDLGRWPVIEDLYWQQHAAAETEPALQNK